MGNAIFSNLYISDGAGASSSFSLPRPSIASVLPKNMPTTAAASEVATVAESGRAFMGLSGGEWTNLLVRLGISVVASALLMRYMVNLLEPDRHKREAAEKRAREVLKRLSVDDRQLSLTKHELEIAADLACAKENGVDWTDIGGTDDIIRRIDDRVLLPLRLDLSATSSPLLAPPKGVLLHGPPGCGKTLLARAMARAAGARFINLQTSTILDKWYGESNKYAVAVFTLAKKLQPTIIFIDEIDSFLRARNTGDHEATAMLKAQFMQQWDGFASGGADANCRVLLLGATNRPRDVDLAILRRMPFKILVGLPNAKQRQEIFKVILRTEELDSNVNMEQLAEATVDYSGSDLKEVCRLAAIQRIKELFNSGVNVSGEIAADRPLNMTDLQTAVHEFAEAKDLRCFSSQDVGDFVLD